MLKTHVLVKFNQQAAEALRAVLASVPVVDRVKLRRLKAGGNADLEATLRLGVQPYTLMTFGVLYDCARQSAGKSRQRDPG
jgi:hypothetical protein